MQGQQLLVPGLWAQGQTRARFSTNCSLCFPSDSKGSPDLKELLFLFHSFLKYFLFLYLTVPVLSCGLGDLPPSFAACNKFLKLHLFIWLQWVSVAACRIFSCHVVSSSTGQESNRFLCIGSTESQPLYHQRNPKSYYFKSGKRVNIGKLFRENWRADTLYIPIIKTGLGLFRENSSRCLEMDPGPAFSVGRGGREFRKLLSPVLSDFIFAFVFKKD